MPTHNVISHSYITPGNRTSPGIVISTLHALLRAEQLRVSMLQPLEMNLLQLHPHVSIEDVPCKVGQAPFYAVEVT
jgi:hypothetical protein